MSSQWGPELVHSTPLFPLDLRVAHSPRPRHPEHVQIASLSVGFAGVRPRVYAKGNFTRCARGHVCPTLGWIQAGAWARFSAAEAPPGSSLGNVRAGHESLVELLCDGEETQDCKVVRKQLSQCGPYLEPRSSWKCDIDANPEAWRVGWACRCRCYFFDQLPQASTSRCGPSFPGWFSWFFLTSENCIVGVNPQNSGEAERCCGIQSAWSGHAWWSEAPLGMWWLFGVHCVCVGPAREQRILCWERWLDVDQDCEHQGGHGLQASPWWESFDYPAKALNLWKGKRFGFSLSLTGNLWISFTTILFAGRSKFPCRGATLWREGAIWCGSVSIRREFESITELWDIHTACKIQNGARFNKQVCMQAFFGNATDREDFSFLVDRGGLANDAIIVLHVMVKLCGRRATSFRIKRL